jgi:hypothetical protein
MVTSRWWVPGRSVRPRPGVSPSTGGPPVLDTTKARLVGRAWSTFLGSLYG